MHFNCVFSGLPEVLQKVFIIFYACPVLNIPCPKKGIQICYNSDMMLMWTS